MKVKKKEKNLCHRHKNVIKSDTLLMQKERIVLHNERTSHQYLSTIQYVTKRQYLMILTWILHEKFKTIFLYYYSKQKNYSYSIYIWYNIGCNLTLNCIKKPVFNAFWSLFFPLILFMSHLPTFVSLIQKTSSFQPKFDKKMNVMRQSFIINVIFMSCHTITITYYLLTVSSKKGRYVRKIGLKLYFTKKTHTEKKVNSPFWNR